MTTAFFLALGFTLLIAFSTLLISGGVLDLSPLSGVVTPFLSYGGTAMIANFAIFGILLSLSRSQQTTDHTEPFRLPVRRLAQVLGLLAFAVVAKAAWIQIVRGRRNHRRRHSHAASRRLSAISLQSSPDGDRALDSREAQSTTATACRSRPATSRS